MRSLVKNIYSKKLQVKMYSPYLYGGEQKAKQNYFNLRYFQNNNREQLG